MGLLDRDLERIENKTNIAFEKLWALEKLLKERRKEHTMLSFQFSCEHPDEYLIHDGDNVVRGCSRCGYEVPGLESAYDAISYDHEDAVPCDSKGNPIEHECDCDEPCDDCTCNGGGDDATGD